jgi:hypothetical protein
MYHAREQSYNYWRRNYNLCNIELKVTDNLWEASKNQMNQVMDYAIQHEIELNHQTAMLWTQAVMVEQQRVEATERVTTAEIARDEALAEAIETAENFEYVEHTLQQECKVLDG